MFQEAGEECGLWSGWFAKGKNTGLPLWPAWFVRIWRERKTKNVSYFAPQHADITIDPQIQTTIYTPVTVYAVHNYTLFNDTDHEVVIGMTCFLYDNLGNRADDDVFEITVYPGTSGSYKRPQQAYVDAGYDSGVKKVTWTAMTRLQVLTGYSQPPKVNGGNAYLNVVTETNLFNEHGELVNVSEQEYEQMMRKRRIKIVKK